MRKLLVLLVALVTVAAFAAVNFSGGLYVTPKLTYDTGTGGLTTAISVSPWLSISSSGESDNTGFVVTFSGWSANVTTDTYVWQKLYKSESFNVTLKAGLISRGVYAGPSYFSGIIGKPALWFGNEDGTEATVGLDMAIASGDLSDSLVLYLYPSSTATSVDADLVNNLSFGFLSVGFMARGIFGAVSGGTVSFPGMGASVSIDLAKALNIENATLRGFGGVAIDPAGTDLASMLEDYVVGLDLGYDKFNASLAFQKGNKLGIAVKTTVLSPVTIGADIVLPDMTDITEFNLAAYASWTTELLSHRVSVKYTGTAVELAWRLGVYF
ncbi:MAG: hypothetical protein H5T93_09765 [Pseudothermotoga sp.]|uniref:hypothetical protein n=1 Tax=Pseudothermotoga sp. TaxID=2033661 RepID=UPI001982B66A|nr:hypothetical protein [Pseudothermotoga sp.]